MITCSSFPLWKPKLNFILLRGRQSCCKTFDKLVAWQVKNASISFMPTTGRGEWQKGGRALFAAPLEEHKNVR